MSSENSKSNKRELILAAAVQVFSRKGYHNARMEQIAVTAGIGKGTIYEYFDSKVQLFQAMLENSWQIYYTSLTPEEINQMSFEQRLSWLLMGHFEFCLANRELAKVVFWDEFIFDDELKEWSLKTRREKEDRMQDIIKEGIRRKEIRADLDIKLGTAAILGIIGAAMAPIVLEGWETDPAVTADKITNMIMNGIGPV